MGSESKFGSSDSTESILAPERSTLKNIDWNKIIAAYQNGLTADMLQAEYRDGQGVTWTVAPCDSDALERAGRQFSRSRAVSLWHIRRAVLRHTSHGEQSVVIATELPTRRQHIRELATAEEIPLQKFLQDAALIALEASFVPSAEMT